MFPFAGARFGSLGSSCLLNVDVAGALPTLRRAAFSYGNTYFKAIFRSLSYIVHFPER